MCSTSVASAFSALSVGASAADMLSTPLAAGAAAFTCVTAVCVSVDVATSASASVALACDALPAAAPATIMLVDTIR